MGCRLLPGLRLAAALALVTSIAAPAIAAEVAILFVGNSFTHGRYDPVRAYHAGFGAGDVHDLLCRSPATCAAAERGVQVDPSRTPPPGSLQQQLAYLAANPSARYSEPGPFGGVPGIFLQLTRDAGLRYSVSLIAVSSATLAGYLDNRGKERGDLPLIEAAPWDAAVLQEQSFRPLPATLSVNGRRVATRGDFTAFERGVGGLIDAIDAVDRAAGKPDAAITLYETQPLASYGYASNNPDAPIFGRSASPPGGPNAPYVGGPNPIAAMANDLHNAYEKAAADYMASNPAGSRVAVAPAGDAWVGAIAARVAVRNPYLAANPPSRIDLWDSNPLDACCTTPIGYHASPYGAYLSALVLFAEITGVPPASLAMEFESRDPRYRSSASHALGVAPAVARRLAAIAAATVEAGRPARQHRP